jgi:hypothetical protein
MGPLWPDKRGEFRDACGTSVTDAVGNICDGYQPRPAALHKDFG